MSDTEEKNSIIFRLVMMVFILVLGIGVIWFSAYQVSNSVLENTKEITLEKNSCEITSRLITILEHPPIGINIDESKKLLQEYYKEMDCVNPNSIYWRGEDWSYENQTDYRIIIK